MSSPANGPEPREAIWMGWGSGPTHFFKGFPEPLDIGPEYISLGLGCPAPGVWGQARSGFRYREAVLWGAGCLRSAGRSIYELLSCILGRE